MKFYIKTIALWLRDGSVRKIDFKPNKVNVITGDSITGKTAILDIIDYCFFSSESKIAEAVINENTTWYGLTFSINEKDYTVARKSLIKGKVSNDYYFSSEGDLPESIENNTTEAIIKSILETEFNINSKVAIPYGSNSIKAGSKISLRYFLMFNTISVNIIENDTGSFFDKQNNSRYRDALPRIFDLALGIETIENILKKEKKAELEADLARLVRKTTAVSVKSEEFKTEQASLIKKAKQYSLIDSNLDFDSSLNELKRLTSDVSPQLASLEENDRIEHDVYLKERKIKNLKRFITEYDRYKKGLKSTVDSLKPILFLKKRDADVIKTPVFHDIMNSLSSELMNIRKACTGKTPIDRQVNDEIALLEAELLELKAKLSIIPSVNQSFDNEKSKYFFLGEVKTKIDLYSSPSAEIPTDITSEISALEEQIESIQIVDNTKKRNLTISLIEEVVGEYIKITGTALGNYANHLPHFSYKDKKLFLRKQKASFIENIGSSSNHMFLQLFFTLAMHETAFQNESPFIAPFIIIDQPSRPYYGSDSRQKKDLGESDQAKITKAFELLDKFVETRISNSSSFQMIVFEHVPESIFEGLPNVHLVERFNNGNALIPSTVLENLDSSTD